MANSNVNNLGQINNTGDNEALFLKLFSGEVYGAFIQKTIMLDKQVVKTISGGSSYQFPIVGKVSSGTYTPGEEILGQNINQAEQTINIDAKVIADVFIDEVDAKKNHYNIEGEYTKQMGAELANKMDRNSLQTLVKAARATNVVDGLDGGTELKDNNLGSDDVEVKAQAFKKAIFDAGVALDEKNAPEERFAILKPADYAALAQLPEVISSDYDGMGSISKGTILELNGIKIFKSNNLPNTDTSADTVNGVDATKTKGLVFTTDAVGMVKLNDITVDNAYDIRRQGTLFVAKYVVGHGILRPECAVELKLEDD
jgi:hypothetical protein